jgi:hypothetical protein
MAGLLKTEVLVVVGVAVAVLVMANKAKEKVTEAASDLWDYSLDKSKYLNPTSDKNIFYQGASALTHFVFDTESNDLGVIVWDYVHKAQPIPGGNGALVNYTKEEQDADYKAMKQLEAGYHGM